MNKFELMIGVPPPPPPFRQTLFSSPESRLTNVPFSPSFPISFSMTCRFFSSSLSKVLSFQPIACCCWGNFLHSPSLIQVHSSDARLITTMWIILSIWQHCYQIKIKSEGEIFKGGSYPICRVPQTVWILVVVGIMLILFCNMSMVRKLQHGNLPIN